jgi:amidase
MEGLPGIHPSAGPLANSLEDLDLFTSSVLNTEIWKYDVTAIGAAWSPKPQLEDGTKLRIGVLDEHHLLPLHPPVRRALQTATQALAAAGHEIVRITQDGGRDIALGNRIAFQYFTYAPHPDQIAASGEPPVPSVAKRAHPMFTGPSPVSTDSSDFELINELQIARDRYSDAWRKTWVAHKLDVMIGPPAQNTAVPYDTFGWPPYTLFLNLIDVSVDDNRSMAPTNAHRSIPHVSYHMAVPIRTWIRSPSRQPTMCNQAVSLPLENIALSAQLTNPDDPEATHGAPCSVQVFTPRFQDERCLAVAHVINRVLNPKP